MEKDASSRLVSHARLPEALRQRCDSAATALRRRCLSKLPKMRHSCNSYDDRKP